MKRKRYTQPQGKKELPSRKKLAAETQKLKVVIVQQSHELRCERQDLEQEKHDHQYWKRMTELGLAENQRLRKQLVELLPEDTCLSVRPWTGPHTPVYWSVPGLEVRFGVDINVMQFKTMRRSSVQAYKQAVAEDVARKVHVAMLEQFKVLER